MEVNFPSGVREMLERSRAVVLCADDWGKLSKSKQLELRIASGHLRTEKRFVCGRVSAGETPCLGNVGVNLWEINDECQSAEELVLKQGLKLNVSRGLNEFESAV